MNNIEIFSAASCPFAQRSRLVLLEKAAPFTLCEIDLDNKPDWFGEVSPHGRVPVIRHGGEVIWESSVINEYLNEVYPDPPLLPSDPPMRARARIWIDYANTKLVPAFYGLLSARGQVGIEDRRDNMFAVLRFMEKEGLARQENGPYWLGADVSLVDFTFYPFFERWGALVHYRGCEIPDDCLRLKRWVAAMSERASVRKIENPPEFYINHYREDAED